MNITSNLMSIAYQPRVDPNGPFRSLMRVTSNLKLANISAQQLLTLRDPKDISVTISALPRFQRGDRECAGELENISTV